MCGTVGYVGHRQVRVLDDREAIAELARRLALSSRGAVTIVLAEEADETVRPYADHLIEIPAVSTLLQPLLSTIPLQVFAASVAQAQGYDVHKPRNLAKSVTVE